MSRPSSDLGTLKQKVAGVVQNREALLKVRDRLVLVQVPCDVWCSPRV